MDWSPGYREQPPPAALLPSVACLWARVVGPGADAVTEVLPDACVDLIWEQGAGVYVAGPDTGPVPSPSPAGAVLAALRFVPGAAGPALGMPMSALLNQRVAASDLGTAQATALARALPGSLAPAEALRVLVRATGAMSAEGQAAVGYGPATLRRVLRFRRFVSWADAGAPGGDLASAAARLGYADQAHLTRECVRLAGLTPTALLAARRPGDEWRGPGPSELARTAGPPTARHRQATRKR